MTVSDFPQFLIGEASKRGQDIFEVIFENWGYVQPGPPRRYDNVSYPNAATDPPAGILAAVQGIPFSLAGIAIGPRSLVDRAWVSFNLQKQPAGPVMGPLITDRVRRLSVDSPLYYTHGGQGGRAINQTPAVPDAFWTQYSQNLLYVFAAAKLGTTASGFPYSYEYPIPQETTVLPDEVIKATGGTQVFGFDADTLDRFVFTPPTLHLIFYLKSSITVPPASRFPLQTSNVLSIDPGESGAEICVAQIPIYGRKNVKIDMWASNAYSMRTAVVRAMQEDPARCFEGSSQTAAAAGNISTSLSYSDPCADYLMIYINVTATLLQTDALFSVSAYDR